MGIKMLLNAEAHYGVPVKIYTNDIDSESIDQLKKMSQLQFIHSHIAAMPDVHLGKGATVGSVIPTKNAIIPAAVGVDIGCGMNALRLSLKASQLPDNLSTLRNAIERKVPIGFGVHRQFRFRKCWKYRISHHTTFYANLMWFQGTLSEQRYHRVF